MRAASSAMSSPSCSASSRRRSTTARCSSRDAEQVGITAPSAGSGASMAAGPVVACARSTGSDASMNAASAVMPAAGPGGSPRADSAVAPSGSSNAWMNEPTRRPSRPEWKGERARCKRVAENVWRGSWIHCNPMFFKHLRASRSAVSVPDCVLRPSPPITGRSRAFRQSEGPLKTASRTETNMLPESCQVLF